MARTRKTAELTAVGITSGIGSLLIGARDAGFSVLGNIEWRKYYHAADERGRSTFTENFPGATMHTNVDHMSADEIERMMGATIALGHPECGGFSALSGANKNFRERWLDPADIPLFVDLVAKLKPRFFVMDDLPKSLMAYPMKEYAAKLPDYDLYPEWVSNWGYGNVQKGRKRLFMLGALKSEKWAFIPGEAEHSLLVKDVLEDLPTPRKGSNVPNQDPHDNDQDCFRALNLGAYRKKNTWAETRDYFKDKPGGHTLKYVREDGSIVNRIGFLKGHWEGPAHVLTGQNANLHNLRCEPYTIRERARIQGFPDDFVFYGTILNSKGQWCHDLNSHMVRQTGKAMPVQFARYASKQIMAYVRGHAFESSKTRLLPPDPLIDEAKRWYCQSVGYANQEAACGACWMAARCEIRTERYGYTPLSRPRAPAVKRAEPSGKPRQVVRQDPAPARSVPTKMIDV